MEKKNNNINRRDFLKIIGIAGVTATGLAACRNGANGLADGSGENDAESMSYRTFPQLGNDKVSLLGYGCMRWPTIPANTLFPYTTLFRFNRKSVV